MNSPFVRRVLRDVREEWPPLIAGTLAGLAVVAFFHWLQLS